MREKFNIVVEEGEDGYLIADVIGLPGCRTQARTHDELLSRVKEAIELYMMSQEDNKPRSKFISLQQLEVEI